MGATPPTQYGSLCELFQDTVARHADDAALTTLDGAIRMTYGEYGAAVERVARGLAACGVGPGSTVALLLSNRPEFHVVDAAVLHLGASAVSVYNTLPPEDIAWTVRDAGADVVVTETAQLETVQQALATGAIDPLVVVVDGSGDGATTLETVVDGGSPDFAFEAAWRSVDRDDVAVLIYTSGTTGPPKGVELTHASVLGNVQALHHAIGTIDGARAISYLPMAHAAERQMTHYRAMAFSLDVTTCDDHREIASYLLAVRPHYFFAPPRMLEKFRAGIVAAVPPPVREAIDVAVPAVRRQQAGEALDNDEQTLDRARRTLAPVLAQLGLDEVVVALTGSAPVPPELSEFWIALGLPLAEGWGISECGAFGAVGRPQTYRIGTCGKPLPGIELRFEPDGEILLRSPWLMRGYRGRPRETAEVIDADGWLHTGDIGAYDDEGHLRIVDRKKDIIINAAGKNMSPAHIESRIKDTDALFGDVCVVGDGRPYNVALILLDPEVAARQTNVVGATPAELADDPAVAAAVDEAVTRANERLSRVEQIKRYLVIGEQWVPGGAELTPTMKLKRRAITERYATEIEALYATEHAAPVTATT